MAQSRCIKCEGSKFEIVHANNLEGTTRAVLFVKCTDCGSVVGVLDFLNVSVKAERVKNDLRIMVEKLLDLKLPCRLRAPRRMKMSILVCTQYGSKF